MHRFPSKSTIYRIRFVAFLFCFRCVAVLVVGGVLLYSFIENDHELMVGALGLGLACILICLVQWWLARRTGCPLCQTPVLARNGCAKHRNARTALGSYRLRVAMAILFRGSFHCPYCHEPSVMEVRSRHSRTQTKTY